MFSVEINDCEGIDGVVCDCEKYRAVDITDIDEKLGIDMVSCQDNLRMNSAEVKENLFAASGKMAWIVLAEKKLEGKVGGGN